jgi:predicted NAD/FAD-binding protein
VEDQVRKLGASYNGNIAKQASLNISITFDMNKLQNIPLPGQPGSPGRVLVTMNPTHVPRKSQSSHVYCHPLISSDSVRMADRLDEINGIGSISFAGAWMGFGFHEDGFMAGSHVAKMLINGRENTNGMNLMARLDDHTLRNRGLVLFIVKLIVALVQRLIDIT